MGIDLRRLATAVLVAVLLFAGGPIPQPAEKTDGCGCPVPCVKCCCSSNDQGEAELCMLRDRGGPTPRSEMPPKSRPRVSDAVLAAPVPPPHPVLEDHLGIPELLLPVSLVLPPEVPPPRDVA